MKTNLPDASGIYKILNTVNGKFYIGSTNNLRKRRNGHFYSLKAHKHPCKYLQQSFDKYGETKFEFICIEFCPEEKLMEREQFWLDEFWGKNILYNIFREAYSVRGVNHPLYGTQRSEEVKEKIRQRRKFQIIKHSDETKRKIGQKSAIHRHSIETKKKMSAAKLGIKAWNKGKTALTCESLRKASEAARIIIPEPDLSLIITKYKQGFSLFSLAKEFPYKWGLLKSNLIREGILIRSIKDQKKINKNSNRQSRFPECLAKNKGLSVCGGVKEGRFCNTHWSQYYKGLIDKNGNKLRDFYSRKYFKCIAEAAGTGSCTVYKRGRFCARHQNQFKSGIIDTNGNKLRDLKIGSKFPECLAKNAGTGECYGRKKGRFCQRHADHYRSGLLDKNGNKLRDFKTSLKFPVCLAKMAGTGKCAGGKNGRFCRRHYSQFRIGILDKNGNKLRDLRNKKD